MLSCSITREERQNLKRELKEVRLTRALLLNTKLRIEKLLSFFLKTEIDTRKWHLKRLEREEEEEKERKKEEEREQQGEEERKEKKEEEKEEEKEKKKEREREDAFE